MDCIVTKYTKGEEFTLGSFNTVQEANQLAKNEWLMLNDKEKKHCSIKVEEIESIDADKLDDTTPIGVQGFDSDDIKAYEMMIDRYGYVDISNFKKLKSDLNLMGCIYEDNIALTDEIQFDYGCTFWGMGITSNNVKCGLEFEIKRELWELYQDMYEVGDTDYLENVGSDIHLVDIIPMNERG